MLEEIDMEDSWPVNVNSFEAEAFCNFKSEQLGRTVRLINNEEHLLLRGRLQSNDYNIGLRYHSPCPVHKFGEPLGANGEMIYDVMGNLWQHSASPFDVLPGFISDPIYPNYTAELDGLHRRVLGGCWASTGALTSPHIRQSFRRNRHQLAGFRYVESSNPVPPPMISDVPRDLTTPDEVLQFWFDDASQKQITNPKWFPPSSKNYDNDVLLTFGGTCAAAATGRLEHWLETPMGSLAYIIALDQFSRVIFRGRPGAFAHDARARRAVKLILERGFDKSYGPAGKFFGVLLPLEHSEDPKDHELFLELYATYIEAHPGDEGAIFPREFPSFLEKVDMLKRFGRYPTRNDVLGRVNTPDEIEFLTSTHKQ